jgi:hypothetical protein
MHKEIQTFNMACRVDFKGAVSRNNPMEDYFLAWEEHIKK